MREGHGGKAAARAARGGQRRRRGRQGEVRGGGGGGDDDDDDDHGAGVGHGVRTCLICARRKHRVRLCKEGMRKGCLIHGKGRAAATWLTISVLLLLAPRLRAPERVKVSSLEQTCAKRAQGER